MNVRRESRIHLRIQVFAALVAIVSSVYLGHTIGTHWFSSVNPTSPTAPTPTLTVNQRLAQSYQKNIDVIDGLKGCKIYVIDGDVMVQRAPLKIVRCDNTITTQSDDDKSL